MNVKISSVLATLALASVSFAQEPAIPSEAPSVSPDAIAEDVAVPAESVAPAESAAPVAAPVEAPATKTAVAPEAAPTPIAEEAVVPVAVRNGEVPAADAPAVETAAAPAPVVTQATDEDEMAPQAVRGGATNASKPESTKKVVYERVYMGPNGIPVRTLYVAEESDGISSFNPADDQFPIKFRIGATASANSYYLSNDEYNQYGEWYGESFSGFSWRAGVTAMFPLNPNIGFKLGVLYEQSSASESYYIDKIPTQFTFEQKKIDIPALFVFKAFGSRLFFDLGAQISIPLQDKLKASFTDPDTDKKVKSSVDLMDDYRNEVDWNLVFGFSIMTCDYLSLDLRAEIALSDAYEGTLNDLDLGLSSSSFGIGLTIYPF